MKLLFVCTGNTCRSCMAEAIFRDMAKNLKLDIEVSSAGIYAIPGEGASHNSISVMKDMNIDLSCHVSKLVALEMVEDMGLILTMTKAHKSALVSLFPSVKDKVYSLSEYIGEKEDIQDPYGGDISVYKNSVVQIHNCIRKLIIKLMES